MDKGKIIFENESEHGIEKPSNGDYFIITPDLTSWKSPIQGQSEECPKCTGSGVAIEVEPSCCGRTYRSGECRGECAFPVQCQRQCDMCQATGKIGAALAQDKTPPTDLSQPSILKQVNAKPCHGAGTRSNCAPVVIDLTQAENVLNKSGFVNVTDDKRKAALKELDDYSYNNERGAGNPYALSIAGCETIRSALQSNNEGLLREAETALTKALRMCDRWIDDNFGNNHSGYQDAKAVLDPLKKTLSRISIALGERQ